jgi:hypothetical protein
MVTIKGLGTPYFSYRLNNQIWDALFDYAMIPDRIRSELRMIFHKPLRRQEL